MIKYIVGALILVIAASGIYWAVTQTPDTEPAGQLAVRLGFINAIQNEGGYALVFDEATWLTGKDGQDAAIVAGLCTEKTREECLPNDFFILNESTSTEIVRIAPEPLIAMQTLNMEKEGVKETEISIQEFANMINDETAHWMKLPYQILIEDGFVTIVEEVYVP